MTDLGKAYVQIVPSAKGISGQIQSAIGGDVDSAGKSAGESFAGKFAGMFKKALVGLGIGKMIGEAMTQGGQLQQTLGGVETLFKDNADAVKAYAADAFRTTGLSANEYMTNVTGFSASLLQSLGGDTAKAAEVSNMAMVDMADNANKMGTSMESITTAYQGFAKQNYTMLDNLKLGYGGTKSEMERLLADAQKITGVQYDITNLSDVYSAIHVIQGELDITGTTAREASTTLEGSFNSMKAAWTDMLGVVATGGDVSTAMQNLTQTVSTYLFGNFIPMLGNILAQIPGLVTGVITGIADYADEIINTGIDLVVDLITGIVGSVPDMVEAVFTLVESIMDVIESTDWLGIGEELLTSIQTGVSNLSPDLLNRFTDLVIRIVGFLTDNLPEFMAKGAEFILSMVRGIIENLPTIVGTIASMVFTLISEIASKLPEFLSKGYEIVGELISGLLNSIPDLIGAIPKLVSAAADEFMNHDWLGLGMDIVNGIIDGIWSVGGQIGDTLTSLAKGAWTSLKDFFGIASPSKLMRDSIGRYIPEGMAVGIEDNADYVSQAMEDMANTALDLPIDQSMTVNPLASEVTSGSVTNIGDVTINIDAHDYANATEIGNEIIDIFKNRMMSEEAVFA